MTCHALSGGRHRTAGSAHSRDSIPHLPSAFIIVVPVDLAHGRSFRVTAARTVEHKTASRRSLHTDFYGIAGLRAWRAERLPCYRAARGPIHLP